MQHLKHYAVRRGLDNVLVCYLHVVLKSQLQLLIQSQSVIFPFTIKFIFKASSSHANTHLIVILIKPNVIIPIKTNKIIGIGDKFGPAALVGEHVQG